jgi:tetratricopeptide (TPR) repeat protein
MKQPELFQTAVKKAKAGEREQARMMLMHLVEVNPEHELAWLWLSELVEDPEDKIIALENALTINPQRSQTQTRLHKLRQKQAAASQSADHHFSTNGISRIHTFTTEETLFAEINQLFAAGKIVKGRQQLADFLRRYSNHEAGWWLMVQHADSQTNLLIGLGHLLRLNAAHPEVPKMLGSIKPTNEEYLQMGRLYERLERWETAVTYYKRALKSPSNADRLLAQKQLPHVEEQVRLANIKFTSPTVTVLRLAIGPTILYAMLILVQAGLKPTQASPLLCLGNVAFLAGMLLFSGLSHAPEHPWLQQLRETAVFQNKTLLRLVSLLLILLPIMLLLLLAISRLLNFELNLADL